MRHQRLGMRDIWKVPDAQDRVFRGLRAAGERKGD